MSGGWALDDATAADWLGRAVDYSAARLLQAGVEQAQFALRLTGNFICQLQLSLNILRRPRQAATALLGSTEHEVKAA